MTITEIEQRIGELARRRGLDPECMSIPDAVQLVSDNIGELMQMETDRQLTELERLYQLNEGSN